MVYRNSFYDRNLNKTHSSTFSCTYRKQPFNGNLLDQLNFAQVDAFLIFDKYDLKAFFVAMLISLKCLNDIFFEVLSITIDIIIDYHIIHVKVR